MPKVPTPTAHNRLDLRVECSVGQQSGDSTDVQSCSCAINNRKGQKSLKELSVPVPSTFCLHCPAVVGVVTVSWQLSLGFQVEAVRQCERECNNNKNNWLPGTGREREEPVYFILMTV